MTLKDRYEREFRTEHELALEVCRQIIHGPPRLEEVPDRLRPRQIAILTSRSGFTSLGPSGDS